MFRKLEVKPEYTIGFDGGKPENNVYKYNSSNKKAESQTPENLQKGVLMYKYTDNEPESPESPEYNNVFSLTSGFDSDTLESHIKH